MTQKEFDDCMLKSEPFRWNGDRDKLRGTEWFNQYETMRELYRQELIGKR